ncbi:decarboxylating 6-phosphogluconate dehydrogenase [Candidatus Dojkabacteria bacterium]|uniref:Decarboxylating 6-phosphogluconate dehydrogenase n=1 Tax=Candidatus Dojkabacteria bacterium TaxID=2099670 RepID=A0A955IAE8_9BACT|nr:decarboxylating 6-phosphogluconate dehydrogenase [Candidatus Dojkabacteria bacterium]
MKKQIGIIGLGKMGANIARNFKNKGWEVVAYNRTASVTKEIEKEGIIGAYSYEEIASKLEGPRVVWVMVPSNDPATEVLVSDSGILPHLSEGDYLIDAGNSYFKNTKQRATQIETKGVHFVDCGVSGGPEGALNGACCMVGGKKEDFEYLEEAFRDVSSPEAYEFFEGHAAGHFVKMVHNGIEYGMMQSIAEGFDVMKHSEFNLSLKSIARVYGKQSVISSRLIDWALKGFEEYGEDLESISGSASHSGEGEWTVQTAKELDIPIKVIEDSLQARINSQATPSFQGKIISMLRNIFGGHSIN